MSSSTTFPDRSVLVTGANRGIGRVLVEEALRRGGRRVYAGTRQPLAHPDDRVMPVILDVTNPAQIETSVEKVGSLDILINNAGISGAQIIPICTAPSTRTAAPSKYSCPVMRMHAALGAFDGVALVHDGAVHVTRAPH